ncbi:MAG: HAD-IC family P-type ATPase [Elusimicrobiota bacterium]|jgi:P-type E1-E2 ATPase|nr:HAD-IC family P-type ATPase [Elusimicrobiota bacterium]
MKETKQLKDKLIFFAPASYILRGWVSVFAALILIIGYALPFSQTTMLLIALVAFFWGGDLFLIGAFKELRNFYIGFNTFISINTVCVFALYIANNFGQTQIFPINGIILLIPLTFIFANFIKVSELRNIGETFRFMQSLDNFIAKSAVRVDGSEQKKVFTTEIELDDIILIKTGERVPLDSVITKGATLLEEHLLTGNITLSSKQEGDKIFAGTVNKGGVVEARVLAKKNSSRIAKILKAVKESENKKLLSPGILGRYSATLLIAFLLIGLAQFAWGFYSEPQKGVMYWVLLLLFTISLSGPLPYMAAMLSPLSYLKKGAAKFKITINNPRALQTLRKVGKVFIDKTGTLTTGKLEVALVEPASGISEAELITAAYTAQQGNNSIFASALADYAKTAKIKQSKVLSMEMHPSFGSIVKTKDSTIFAGRKTWLEERGVVIENPASEENKTVFYVAVNSKYIGRIYFIDKLRANAKNVVNYLKKEGKEVALLSGDNTGALQAVAKKTGLDEYYGDMFPQDKAAKIAAQNNLGFTTAMIGDSFNDILALLQADASIAFAPTQNTFSTWVDAVIANKDFAAVKKIFEYDKKQQSIIRQNILISALLSLAVLWLVFIAGYAIAWYGMALLTLVAMALIILNSTRLKYD